MSTGLEALLEWHLRRARTRSEDFNSSRGVISLEAICALILGHRRGLAVRIDPRYRAAQVPLLAIYLTEWEGHPLPRATPMTVVTDLVAGAWLRAHGIEMDAAPAPPVKRVQAKRTARVPTASPLADQAQALQALRARIRHGGHHWQQASWRMMLGDVAAARGQLEAAAAGASRRWRDQAMPNPNIVREHVGLALVLGDEAGLRESVPALQAWLRTQEGQAWGIYAHATGYLDLICDLVGGGDRARPSRSAVDAVIGPLPSTRVAAIALADGDSSRFREGIEGMLMEHVKTLERKTSPPPPICEPAVHLVAAARRLAIPVAVHERYATWPVPIEGTRVPCDLLGRAVWFGAV